MPILPPIPPDDPDLYAGEMRRDALRLSAAWDRFMAAVFESVPLRFVREGAPLARRRAAEKDERAARITKKMEADEYWAGRR